MLALALWLPLLAQDSGAAPPSPFDEVHVLELTADAPAIDGRGPSDWAGWVLTGDPR